MSLEISQCSGKLKDMNTTQQREQSLFRKNTFNPLIVIFAASFNIAGKMQTLQELKFCVQLRIAWSYYKLFLPSFGFYARCYLSAQHIISGEGRYSDVLGIILPRGTRAVLSLSKNPCVKDDFERQPLHTSTTRLTSEASK